MMWKKSKRIMAFPLTSSSMSRRCRGMRPTTFPVWRESGQKTALDLIQRFKSVDEIYSSLDSLEIRDTLRAKLRAGEELARMSYQLGKIVTDVPVDTDLPSYTLRESDRPRLAGLLAKLEFFKWIDRWNLSEVTPAAQTEQASAAKEVSCELAGRPGGAGRFVKRGSLLSWGLGGRAFAGPSPSRGRIRSYLPSMSRRVGES